MPGKSHGWSSLAGYSPWDRKESDTTERLHFLPYYSPYWLYQFTTPKVQEGFLFSANSPKFIVCKFFDGGYSGWHEVMSQCNFDLHCISLIVSYVEHLFVCLFTICTSSLAKCLLRSPAQDTWGTPVFIATLYAIARMCKKPRCPSTDEQMMWYMYTMEYYSVIERKEFESVELRKMNVEPVIQSEVSQKKKIKYCILKHIYGI